jgi:glycosyltransferase involved in cell wall biosynthesis
MPVRNDAPVLGNCLADIAKQSFEDFELVVVDDGSTDETTEMLQKAKGRDSRIRIIRTSANGIVSALNTGLAECKGNYIARMDADDRMEKTRLEKQLEMMIQNPELDLIGCRVEGFTDSGIFPESGIQYQSWSNSLISHEQIVCDLFAESPIVHPTFFATRELFNKIGGYSENPWAEDYDVILRAYEKGAKFGKHPETLLRKYHAPGRLSRREAMYKRPAMFEAKAHFLQVFGWLKNRRGVLIVGSGPTGRQAAQSFENRGVKLLGFVDNRPGPPERYVKGKPAWGFPELPPPEFLEQFRDALIVLAIGDSSGQRAFSELLQKNGFVENHDFVRVIYNWPPASRCST